MVAATKGWCLLAGLCLLWACASPFRPVPPEALPALDLALPLPAEYTLELQGRLGWRQGDEALTADFLLYSQVDRARLELSSPLGPPLAVLVWGKQGLELPPGRQLPWELDWLPQSALFLRELAWGRALGPDWVQGEAGKAAWGQLQVSWEGEVSPQLPVPTRIVLLGPEGERLTLLVRQARLGYGL